MTGPFILILAQLATALASADEIAGSQPRLVVERVRADPETCWSLRAEGFPAMDDAAGVVVVPSLDVFQLNPVRGSMSLEWHDVVTGELRASQALIPELEVRDAATCRRFLAELRRRVDAVNLRLAAGAWRPIPRLPVAYLPVEETKRYRLEVPAQRRRLQLAISRGELLTRIPGVNLLGRQALQPRMGSELFSVFGDRRSGVVVVVTTACAGESCTCDPGFRAQVLRWEPTLFDAVARLPCDPADAEYMTCEPHNLDLPDHFLPWSL